MVEVNDINQIPGEEFFVRALQNELTFQIGKKQIKKGRLILFRKAHFHIIFTLMNCRNNKENFEIPIPFKIEHHRDENALYFDYRLRSLVGNNTDAKNKLKKLKIRGIEPSQFYNKIIEVFIK
jgi:hypothetical protein